MLHSDLREHLQAAGSSPTGAQLTYDAERRLTSWQNAPTNPSSQAWFLYDGEGHRVEQYTSGGSGNHTYYLPGNVEEVTPSGTLVKYYSAGGLALGLNTGIIAYVLALRQPSQPGQPPD